MQYKTLGRTGIEVSRICLGMMSFGSPQYQPWVLGPEHATAFVRRALELGINFFDTADSYSNGLSEVALGSAIRELTDRSKVVIATKAGLPMFDGPNGRGMTRKRLLTAIDESLRRLGTDYVDIFMLHQPDPSTPAEVTMTALDDIVRSGRALHAGVSNFPVWRHAEMQRAIGAQPVAEIDVVQLQYNLAYREVERELLPLARAFDMGVTVYSPLARGLLAQPPSARLTANEARRLQTDAKAKATYGEEADRRIAETVAGVAEELGVPMARLALAWVLSKQEVTSVLSGALELDHINEAVAALDVVLDQHIASALEAPYEARPEKPTDTMYSNEGPADDWWKQAS